MAIFKPFRALRPPKELASKVASRPYDVLNSEEARREAQGNIHSLLHITKSEIDLDPEVDIHSQEVYDKAVENFKMFQKRGYLLQERKSKFYIYAQTMNGHRQYGLVGCSHIDDYINGVIKKHELTRKDKEDDRMIHVRINNANIEPVFFTYPAVNEIDVIVKSIVENEAPEYDFTSDDGVGHHFWVINDEIVNHKIVVLFEEKVPYTYVADGHHRTAAAARVGLEQREKDKYPTPVKEYNYFLSVLFPDNQLQIIDYNRVVKDLNNHSKEELLQLLEKHFKVREFGPEVFAPQKLHQFSMYLDGKWYILDAKDHTYDDNDPIGVLDVTILSKYVLDEMLDIKDLRTSNRIDFVGGIRGLAELERRVDSGEMAAAFALYPVSMKQLIDIADSGNIMPPKTTWFEPKLRSGLAIHQLDEIDDE
jgi:uncharacterized protein (DUF1015 family)